MFEILLKGYVQKMELKDINQKNQNKKIVCNFTVFIDDVEHPSYVRCYALDDNALKVYAKVLNNHAVTVQGIGKFISRYNNSKVLNVRVTSLKNDTTNTDVIHST